MHAQPQKEHEWLKKFIGEWTCESECSMGPDQPKQKSKGTERVRSLGGLWVIGEGEGEMPGGGSMRSILTLGYDPMKGRFVGTWIASMMTYLWVYDGELDAAQKRLTLNVEGPDFAVEGKMAKYQDIHEFKSADHRVLTSRTPGPDGKWHEIMTANYRRTK